jgi:hypothetical protein
VCLSEQHQLLAPVAPASAATTTNTSSTICTNFRRRPQHDRHEGLACGESEVASDSPIYSGCPVAEGNAQFLKHPRDKLLAREGVHGEVDAVITRITMVHIGCFEGIMVCSQGTFHRSWSRRRRTTPQGHQ